MAVRLYALGECVIETEVARFGPEARYVFASALYLTLERGKRVPRQALIDLLWPDVKDERHARHRFRQNLLRLRQLGVPVQSQQGHVMIRRDAAGADFDPVFESANGEAAEVLRARGSSGFLPGYSPAISAEFTSWLELHRSRVNIGLQRAFVHEIQAARVRGDWTEVEQLCVECLRLDPFHEEATMARAEAAVMCGSKVQALAILDAYMEALGDNSAAIGLPAKILRSRIAERVHEPRYVALSERHFVGREAEVEQLTHMLDEAKAGRGGSCLITGEPGIGKTRLIQEMTNIAEMKGIRVVVARCQPTDVDRPLSVFADTVPVLQALPGALGVDPQTLQLLERLTNKRQRTYADELRAGDPAIVFGAVRHAIFDLLDSVLLETPVFLVFEDVHWLDGHSQIVLRTLVECAPRRRILAVVTTRQGVPAPSVGDLEFGSLSRLAPLSDTQSATLIERLAEESDSEMSDAMRAWCAEICEGNPYHARELVTHWVERREPFHAPRALSELVADRVGRLTTGARLLLQFISLFGRHSTHERLLAATELATHDFLYALEELTRASLVRCHGPEIQPRHDLIRQAALDACGDPVLTALHCRVAVVLESEANVKHDAAVTWACITNWHAAGESGRAFERVTDFVTYLIAVGLSKEALASADRAVDLAQTRPERAIALKLKANAARAAAHWPTVRDTLDSLRPIVGDDDVEMQLLSLEASWRLWRVTRENFDRVLACVNDSTTTPPLRARAAYFALAMCDYWGSDSQITSTLSSIEPLLEMPPIDERLRLSLTMIYHADHGDFQKAESAADKATRLIDGAPPWETLRTWRNAAVVFRRGGRMGDAETAARKAFEEARRCGAAERLADATELIASLYLHRGEVELAEHWLNTASPEFASALPSADNIDYVRARIAWHRGDQDRFDEFTDQYCRDWQADPYLRLRLMKCAFAVARDVAHERVEQPDVTTLADLFARFQRFGMIDYPALMLYNAMASIGREAEGFDFLSRFVATGRHDRSPLYPPLARALEERKIVLSGVEGQAGTRDIPPTT